MLWACLLLAAAAAPAPRALPSGQEDDRPAAGAGEKQPPAAEGRGRYHAERDLPALLSGWLGTGLCEELSLEPSAGGRVHHGVQLGGWGQTPLAERTTILLVGGLDGVSLAGSEAVVRVVDALLAAPDRLPSDVTFVALPWANPDGLARSLAIGGADGRNGRPLDDDRDGSVDEDGPDDLDGDGAILELLVEDPAGSWVRCADGRFLRPALPGEAPRYLRAAEGRDDDGDGRYNEDGPGGVALERNFPLGWRGPLVDPAVGPWPLSEPCSRAVADLALARRTAVALFFQGNHGGVAFPSQLGRVEGGAVSEEDRRAFGTLRTRFAGATGRVDAAPLGVERSVAAGRAPEWLYGSLGVLAAEVACWGPEVEGGASDALDGRFVPGDWKPGVAPGSVSSPRDGRELSLAEQSWSRWLDDLRGGLGFVDWQPVDLGDGRQGLVGGWEPRTCVNPPPAVLEQALAGVERFVLDVAQALPRLELELAEARRDGALCTLRLRVRNLGALPSGLMAAGEASQARVELELAEGVELLGGAPLQRISPVPGSGASQELSWLVLAPEGTVFTFRVRSPWSAAVVREVRL